MKKKFRCYIGLASGCFIQNRPATLRVSNVHIMHTITTKFDRCMTLTRHTATNFVVIVRHCCLVLSLMFSRFSCYLCYSQHNISGCPCNVDCPNGCIDCSNPICGNKQAILVLSTNWIGNLPMVIGFNGCFHSQ